MENSKYQQAFRYIGTLLYSVFVGFLVSFLIRMTHGVLLYPSYYFEASGFHIPEFIALAGFFLGGILAPWLIPLFFGTVDKKIAITSYCFTTILTIVNIILIINSVELEGFGNSWSLLFYLVFSVSIIPSLILSHLFLYPSYKRRTPLPVTEPSTKFRTENQQDQHIFHRFTFRCTSVVSFSLFLGSFFGLLFMQFLNVIPWILQSDDFYEFFSSYTHSLFPLAFFLGGILALWLISLFFGTVDRKITITSYCLTAFFTVISIIFTQNEKLSSMMIPLIYSGITPLFILSCLLLYLSFRKQATKGA